MFLVEDDNSRSLLSSTIKSYLSFLKNEDLLSNKKVKELLEENIKVLNIETNSKRIVLVKNNTESLSFHLAYINEKWYLFILDFITADCSV